MLKGKMYYKNKKIKYKIVMEKLQRDYYISIKTKLGEFKLFNESYTLDEVKYSNPFGEVYYLKEYEPKRNEFLSKWNKYSSK